MSTVFSEKYLKRYFSAPLISKFQNDRPKYADVVVRNEIVAMNSTSPKRSVTFKTPQHTTEP